MKRVIISIAIIAIITLALFIPAPQSSKSYAQLVNTPTAIWGGNCTTHNLVQGQLIEITRQRTSTNGTAWALYLLEGTSAYYAPGGGTGSYGSPDAGWVSLPQWDNAGPGHQVTMSVPQGSSQTFSFWTGWEFTQVRICEVTTVVTATPGGPTCQVPGVAGQWILAVNRGYAGTFNTSVSGEQTIIDETSGLSGTRRRWVQIGGTAYDHSNQPKNTAGLRGYSNDPTWFVAGANNFITASDLSTDQPVGGNTRGRLTVDGTTTSRVDNAFICVWIDTSTPPAPSICPQQPPSEMNFSGDWRLIYESDVFSNIFIQKQDNYIFSNDIVVMPNYAIDYYNNNQQIMRLVYGIYGRTERIRSSGNIQSNTAGYRLNFSNNSIGGSSTIPFVWSVRNNGVFSNEIEAQFSFLSNTYDHIVEEAGACIYIDVTNMNAPPLAGTPTPTFDPDNPPTPTADNRIDNVREQLEEIIDNQRTALAMMSSPEPTVTGTPFPTPGIDPDSGSFGCRPVSEHKIYSRRCGGGRIPPKKTFGYWYVVTRHPVFISGLCGDFCRPPYPPGSSGKHSVLNMVYTDFRHNQMAHDAYTLNENLSCDDYAVVVICEYEPDMTQTAGANLTATADTRATQDANATNIAAIRDNQRTQIALAETANARPDPQFPEFPPWPNFPTSQAFPSAIGIGSETGPGAAPSAVGGDYVAMVPAPAGHEGSGGVGSVPDLGISFPTLIPRAATGTPMGGGTAVMTTTMSIALVGTMQTGMGSPVAMISTVTTGYSWQTGTAQGEEIAGRMEPALNWVTILHPSHPSWNLQCSPLYAIAPIVKPLLPVLVIGLVVGFIRFFLFLISWLLRLADIIAQVFQVIRG